MTTDDEFTRPVDLMSKPLTMESLLEAMKPFVPLAFLPTPRLVVYGENREGEAMSLIARLGGIAELRTDFAPDALLIYLTDGDVIIVRPKTEE